MPQEIWAEEENGVPISDAIYIRYSYPSREPTRS